VSGRRHITPRYARDAFNLVVVDQLRGTRRCLGRALARRLVIYLFILFLIRSPGYEPRLTRAAGFKQRFVNANSTGHIDVYMM